MAVGSTYTPATGLTPQGTQLNSAIQTLQGMGQIANPVQGFQQANQATNQAIAGFPEYANNQAAGLYNAANLDPLIQQHGLDLNTFVQMLQNDPMGQRYLDPTYASAGPTTQTIGGQPVQGVVSALPQQTLANVNTPYAGADSPMAAMSTGNMQAGANVQTLNLLGQAIGDNLSKMQSQLTQNLGGYNSRIQLLQNLADRYMQQANYNLSVYQSGLGTNPLDTISAVEEATGKPIDFATARKIYKQAADSAFTTAQSDQIAKAFKTKYGKSLYPTPLPAAETANINNTYTTIDKIDSILTYLQTHKHPPAGVWGNLQQMLYGMGLGKDFDPLTAQYLSDLVGISGGGERQLIGGRLTGYLLQRLGIAFPSVQKSRDQNISILTQLRKELINDLNTYARNQGYQSYLTLPGSEIIGGTSE